MAEAAGVTEAELAAAAAALVRELPPGGVLWLSGELGAGKTAFVQALARAAGARRATSPTYALVHEYAAPDGPLVHVDCYRLRTPAEAEDLDFPGLLKRARLLAIEWPEKAGPWAPAPDVHLRLAHTTDPGRRRVERLG